MNGSKFFHLVHVVLMIFCFLHKLVAQPSPQVMQYSCGPIVGGHIIAFSQLPKFLGQMVLYGYQNFPQKGSSYHRWLSPPLPTLLQGRQWCYQNVDTMATPHACKTCLEDAKDFLLSTCANCWYGKYMQEGCYLLYSLGPLDVTDDVCPAP